MVTSAVLWNVDGGSSRSTFHNIYYSGGHANAGGASKFGGRAVIAGVQAGVDGAGRGSLRRASEPEGRRGGAQRTVGVGG